MDKDHITCRCPQCLAYKYIGIDTDKDLLIQCEKCKESVAFQRWKGYWQLEEREKSKRKVTRESQATHDRLKRKGLSIAVCCLLLLGFLSYWLDLLPFLVFYALLFAIVYALTRALRGRWKDVIGVSWLGVMVYAGVGLFKLSLLLWYSGGSSLEIGVMALLIFLILAGSLFMVAGVEKRDGRYFIKGIARGLASSIVSGSGGEVERQKIDPKGPIM